MADGVAMRKCESDLTARMLVLSFCHSVSIKTQSPRAAKTGTAQALFIHRQKEPASELEDMKPGIKGLESRFDDQNEMVDARFAQLD
eukprot:766562-Hanusia_phi.AAC.5